MHGFARPTLNFFIYDLLRYKLYLSKEKFHEFHNLIFNIILYLYTKLFS